MAVSYPDIIGDYLNITERFGAGGIHIAGYFAPDTVALGDVTQLFLFIQNNLNIPIEVQLKLTSPQGGGFLQKKVDLLKIRQSVINLKMTQAEAGLLTIPMTTTNLIKVGQWRVGVNVAITSKNRGERIRPTSAKCNLPDDFFDTPMGLDLVSSLGTSYTESPIKKAGFNLTVSGGSPKPLQSTQQLQHKYEVLWKEESLPPLNKAIHEINSRQVQLRDELTREQLFVNLYGESTARFADAGQPLRVGEAITLAKILTYTCEYFLNNSDLSSGLLVPIWERAFAGEEDTTEGLEIVRTTGYYHIIRLAAALSFGLLAKKFNKQNWSLEERRLVGKHIADSLELGQNLDLEFLYLPLLLAGTLISREVKLTGEDSIQSLALMKAARDARAELFTDEDFALPDKIYNRILNDALK
jgi:hypothetical protein